MKKEVKVESNSIGFYGLLTICFIVLKLIGYIDWSWFWVLFPLILNFGLSLLLFIVLIIIDSIE